MDGEHYNLTRATFNTLVRATLRKLRNAADLGDDGKILWSIIEVAVKDAMGVRAAGVSQLERDRNQREARDWLNGQKCRDYCGLIGLDYAWFIERIRRLQIAESHIQ